ncbi:unnamed protein product [Pedinophyceae sp. YPF-701]|nr:unnamed protein product [Pedinophyceae sp. YPF-701]
MVLESIGQSVAQALADLRSKPEVDEETFKGCMKIIQVALIQSDVNVKTVKTLTDNVRKAVFSGTQKGDKLAAVERAVFRELVRMIDTTGGQSLWAPKRGRPNVVMFVGLQGAGKTTTIMKYAHHFKRKGFKPAMVCADTFRAGAFDQLKQNATKIGLPFYGSYTQTDPAVIAREGVQILRDKGRDLIIVDTSGRHKQSGALFEEMRQVASNVQPDFTIFVMDASIGQAALEQAKAFKEAVEIGAVIMTKLDGHAKGGGALSAVAATKSPVLFVGTGEHVDQFEVFDPESFVSRMLNKGDVKGLVNKLSEVLPEDGSGMEMVEELLQGRFTIRAMRQQFQQVLSMGPMSQVMEMIPGLQGMMSGMDDRAGSARIKRFLAIMDSMAEKELDMSADDAKKFEPARMKRIAWGAGVPEAEVALLLEQFKTMSRTMENLKGLKMPKTASSMNARTMQQNMRQMSQALPQGLMQMVGGESGLANMMSKIGGALPGLGGGSAGGPDSAALANMMSAMGGAGRGPGRGRGRGTPGRGGSGRTPDMMSLMKSMGMG